MVEGRAAPYVFVSYASADRARAIEVAEVLEGAGVAVWLDRRSIAGGTSWSAEIVAGVKGCAALVLLVSPAAMQSPNVGQEVQLGWEARRPLLPLLLERAPPPPAIEYALAGRQWVELLDRPATDWRPDLLRALAGLGLPPTDRATPGAIPPPTSPEPPAAPRDNLPVELTSFVGREREIAEVGALLGAHRLVTLTGVGGTGKTRLALAVAGTARETVLDGVWLVELAPLADPALVPQAIATVVGVREQPGEALATTLARALRERQLLLLLDNCEHLIDACSRLAAELLRHCPTLRVLATSREQLGVPGEATYRVPSLALPASDTPPTSLVESEAVRLFLTRAQAARPGLALTDANAALVAQVCARLDGIPLALELAAARLRALPLDQLAARLNDRFRLLTGGSRTALPRQQTLQATLDWSHRLLDEDERTLFRRLSVFAGGWTLDAAEAICADDSLESWRVLDLLTGLVDKSLVILDESGDAGRYRLLETMRQYARERLDATEEGAAVRDHHRDWCLALAEQAAPLLRTGAQEARLALLDAEVDNLRAALAWSQAGDVATGLRLAASLHRYWFYRARLAEGIAWMSTFLALAPNPTVARAWAAGALGHLKWFSGGDLGEAEAALQEGVALGRELNAPEPLLTSLRNLILVVGTRYGWHAMATLIDEALALSRTLGDRWSEGILLRYLGAIAYRRGELARGRALLEESLAQLLSTGDRHQAYQTGNTLGIVATTMGDFGTALALADDIAEAGRVAASPILIAGAWSIRGQVALARGETGEAVRHAEQAATLADAHQLGSGAFGPPRLNLARALLAAGDLDRARAHLAIPTQEGVDLGFAQFLAGCAARQVGDWRAAFEYLWSALQHHRDREDWVNAPDSLEALAGALIDDDRSAPAMRLLGAATSARAQQGQPRSPLDQPGVDASLSAARSALGDDAFNDAWAAGAALRLEEAVVEALALLDRLVGEEGAP